MRQARRLDVNDADVAPVVDRRAQSPLVLLSVFLWCVTARPAFSEESIYCQRVRARAAEDAALLLWPRLVAEAVRFPSFTEAVGPTLGGSGIQVRLGVSISPTDMVRGARLDAAADAECELHEASEALRQVLLESADAATLAASKGQAAFLRAHRGEWEALLAQASQRLMAGIITIIELQGLRRSVIELERKLAQVAGETARLEEQQSRSRAASAFDVLAKRYVGWAMGLERQAAGARAFDAFHVGLTGGVIPGFGVRSEWYGLLAISFQLGGLFGAPASRRYLEARQEELEHAEYELPARASEAQLRLSSQMARALRDLEVVESELATNKVTLAALASSRATIAEHARATATLDQLSLDADRVYLSAFVEELSRLSQ